MEQQPTLQQQIDEMRQEIADLRGTVNDWVGVSRAFVDCMDNIHSNIHTTMNLIVNNHPNATSGLIPPSHVQHYQALRGIQHHPPQINPQGENSGNEVNVRVNQ